MTSFPQQNKRLAALWAILLGLMLLWSQGIRLHVHSYQQEHAWLNGGGQEACELAHGSEVHLAIAATDEGHHTEAMSELDISPEGIPVKPDDQPTVWTLINVTILGSPPVVTATVPSSEIRRRRLPHHFSPLPPPLRAPPPHV